MSLKTKYRAWNKEAEFMIEWDGFIEYENEQASSFGFEDYRIFNDDEFELMQFTGLKDRNGREIYEGDIISFEDVRGEKLRKSSIEFAIGRWYLKELAGTFYDIYEEQTSEKWKRSQNWKVKDEQIPVVIGNIHQNPELLEKKK